MSETSARWWGALPASVILDPNIDPVAKVVLQVLALHMGPEGCWPGMARIANAVGRDVRTVARVLRELRDRGLVDWTLEVRHSLRLAVYRFTFDTFGREARPEMEPAAATPDLPPTDVPEPDHPEAAFDPAEPPDWPAEDRTPVTPPAEEPTGQTTGHGHHPPLTPLKTEANLENKSKTENKNPPTPLGRGEPDGAGRDDGRAERPRWRLRRAEIRSLALQESVIGQHCSSCRSAIGENDPGFEQDRWGRLLPLVVVGPLEALPGSPTIRHRACHDAWLRANRTAALPELAAAGEASPPGRAEPATYQPGDDIDVQRLLTDRHYRKAIIREREQRQAAERAARHDAELTRRAAERSERMARGRLAHV